MRILHRLGCLNTWSPAGGAVLEVTEPLGSLLIYAAVCMYTRVCACVPICVRVWARACKCGLRFRGLAPTSVLALLPQQVGLRLLTLVFLATRNSTLSGTVSQKEYFPP